MLQSAEQKYPPNAVPTNSYTPVKPATSPMDQAHIGRSLVIKGEVTGGESLFIDGRIEGTITVPGHRVTIGHNGNVVANIKAKEVVIMGKVQGNVECADRLDLRSESQLSGDVITHRISVEEGAVLKGGIEVRDPEKEKKDQKAPEHAQHKQEAPKATAATASND
jgi:cytoskeletal protein CcmA (bactofilin family)